MNQKLIEPARPRLAQKLMESLTEELPIGTPRHVHGTIALPGKATAVIGMRRAGKTMFLHQLRRERLSRGIARERLPHINFEDEQLAGIEAKDLHLLLEEYYRRYPEFRGKETVTWCFDEIQTVPGWERFVRRVLDSETVEIFLSGSSAALLSQEIATSMRGRAWQVLIHPFSFGEYLRHHGQTIPEQPDFLTGAQRSSLERHFLDYLSVGGFPEAQGLDTETRRILLHDYVDVVMLRDIVERHQVANIAGLRWLVRQLLGNAGSLFSVTKLYSAFSTAGIGISRDMLHRLVEYVQDCFLVRTVWMESGSERQRMVNPRKAYPVDPGLIAVFDRSMRPNTGHALETVVLLELERRRMSISYVRTEQDYEVDFLARRASGEMELIQVCADASRPEVLDRELRALADASAHYPEATCRLLTLTQDGLPPQLPMGVVAQPAYEWLLGRG